MNEKGYTLIEMLLVLFITLLIGSIVIKFTFDSIQHYSHYQIINQLQLKIREYQFLANANKTFYRVFGSGDHFKIFQTITEGEIYEQYMPDGVEIAIGNSRSMVEYYVNSHLEFNGIGDLNFKIGDDYYYYTLNIGKGRVTLEKN